MPSGHVPAHALQHPDAYGGLDCRIRIPQYAIDLLRGYLEEEVGPREEHMSWYSTEFRAAADEAHNALGGPKMTLENAWQIFATMSPILLEFGLV